MVLEILSVSVTNYFTSTPELIRPTHLQVNQVRNLLGYIHLNFLAVAELIMSKLPDNLLQNNYANQLNNVLKQKRGKKGSKEKNQGFIVQIRSNNENIVNLLKNLARQSS